MAGQSVEPLIGLASILDYLEGTTSVEIIQMCVLGREIGSVRIPDVAILTLQGGTTVTAVIGLVLLVVQVLGGLILVLHHFMLLLDAFLAPRLPVLRKGQ